MLQGSAVSIGNHKVIENPWRGKRIEDMYKPNGK